VIYQHKLLKVGLLEIDWVVESKIVYQQVCWKLIELLKVRMFINMFAGNRSRCWK